MAKTARKHPRLTRRQSHPLARTRLVGMIGANRKVLEVLDKHGVSFCAGCYLTLSSPLERVAAYHAVPDLEAFLRDMEKALRRK